MKRKLYFEPIKKTNLDEWITFEYGKIRDVSILQLGTSNKMLLSKDANLSKDTYLPLKNFHTDLKLKRIDKYISKQNNLIYTHEIIIHTEPNFKFDKNILPPSEIILKGVIGNRKIFVKLNFIEVLIIDYYSFSWSNASIAIRLNIIAIISGIIAILVSIILFFKYLINNY